MKITSEIILSNLDKLESARKRYKILDDYYIEKDNEKLKRLYSVGRSFGFLSYLTFIDYIRQTNSRNQQVFYNKKIKIKEFKEGLVNCAIDQTVKKVLQSKGKLSFEKLLNSPKWDIYAGNRNYNRRRRGVRYQDNFVFASSLIANFCIQNELEVTDTTRISSWYTQHLHIIDPSIHHEIEITTSLVDSLYQNLTDQGCDFKKINLDNIISNIQFEIESRMTRIEKGECVKLVEGSDYYPSLTTNKVYIVKGKKVSGGRLQVEIENDNGYTREYPYRIFETVTNLRDSAIDSLLIDL